MFVTIVKMELVGTFKRLDDINTNRTSRHQRVQRFEQYENGIKRS